MGRRFTCIEAESIVQAMFDVTTWHGHAAPDAVHVGQRKPDVVELVQCGHVERLVVVVVRFAMLLQLLATCGSHVDRRRRTTAKYQLCRTRYL